MPTKYLWITAENKKNLFCSKKSTLLMREKPVWITERMNISVNSSTRGAVQEPRDAPCMSCCQVIPTMSALTQPPQQILPMLYAPDSCCDQLKKRSCFWWLFPQELRYYCINILERRKSKIWFCSLYKHDDELLTSFSVISM